MTDHVFFVGESEDGKFYACHEAEPFFCFVRNTEQEAVDVAVATFEEYANLFQHTDLALSARPVTALPIVHVAHKRAYALDAA
jgi:hypothetical protein